MLKIIGLATVCFVVASYGFLKSEAMSFRRKYLTEILMFSENCAQLMRAGNQSVVEILREYSFDTLSFLKNITSDNLISFSSLNELLLNNRIIENDSKQICDFLERLGKGNIEVQENHCKSYSAIFKKMQNEAEHELATKGKLARNLCLLAATAIFIIFI